MTGATPRYGNHNMCPQCWRAQRGDSQPVHAYEQSGETCCWCLRTTTAGIYVRGDNTTTPCQGHCDGRPMGERVEALRIALGHLWACNGQVCTCRDEDEWLRLGQHLSALDRIAARLAQEDAPK